MLPLVSVVIPTYNRAGMLPEAVESVLGQDYPCLELIVVDDGSSDDTGRVLGKYRGRLSYQRQPRRGVSAARNRGAALAKGEYLCFLDSDDLWRPQKLSRQVQYMQANPRVPLCYTDEIWIRNGVRVNPRKKHRKYSGWIFERCLPLCIISPSSAMLRRDFFTRLGGFDESLPACEDYDLWLRICKDHPVHFIPEPLIVKRGGHPDQLSRKYWGNDRFRVRALEKLLSAGNLSPRQQQQARQLLLERCRILAEGCCKRGKKRQAEFYRRKMERYGPAE